MGGGEEEQEGFLCPVCMARFTGLFEKLQCPC